MRTGFVLGLLMLVCSVALAAPGERVALVIGNAAYEVGGLNNPVNDADDIAAALRSIGFDVILARNASREDMLRSLAEFSTKIRPGGLAVAYYSGHGVEVDGENWLLPVKNAVIRTQADVPIYSVSAQDVLRKMEEGGARLNFLILDACRDNPLPSGLKSVGKGLARMDAGTSTLVAYATSPGRTAADGTGRNSPYTAVLKESLKTPGLSVTDLVNQVGAKVQEMTGGAQVPWNSGTPIWPPVMLAGAGVVVQPAASVPAGEGELRIEVSPANARVRLDGVLLGTGSRSVKEVAGKTVLLRAEAEGHEPLEERVRVQGGQVADVMLLLKPVALTQQEPAAPRPAPVTAVATPDPAPVPTSQGRVATPIVIDADAPAPGVGQPYRRRLRSGGEGPEMVVVPAGSFWMGSPFSEQDRELDEGPQRLLQLSAFAIGVTEVTVADWLRCVDAAVCASHAGMGSVQDASERPVRYVSWHDAKVYARWLTEQTGRRYRLPSEAEWEYSARAGTKTRYWWGDEIGTGNANCGDCGDGFPFDSPTRSFRANPWGLFDVAGNVWEWTADCYGGYVDAPGDTSAKDPEGCQRRVLRGGAWKSHPSVLRSASRDRSAPEERNALIGFRLVEVP